MTQERLAEVRTCRVRRSPESKRAIHVSGYYSSEYIRKGFALPASEKRWIMVLTTCFAAVLVASWIVLAPWTTRVSQGTKAVEALSDRTAIITLGSSHIYYSITPGLCTVPLMNLSAAGCDYVFMEGVLNSHIDDLHGLQAVIIEIDVVPLRWDTYEAYEGDYSKVLDLELSISDLSVGLKRKYGLYYQKLFAYSKYFGPLCSRHKFAPRQIMDWWKVRTPEAVDGVRAGYEMHDGLMTPSSAGAARVVRHQRDSETATEKLVQKNIEALVRLIRLVRQRGLRAILLRTPYHRSYWEIRPAEWNAQYDQAIVRLRGEFGENGFIYWDMEREPEFANNEFLNGDHLNTRGAAKFTRFLDERLRSALELKQDLASNKSIVIPKERR